MYIFNNFKIHEIKREMEISAIIIRDFLFSVVVRILVKFGTDKDGNNTLT